MYNQIPHSVYVCANIESSCSSIYLPPLYVANKISILIMYTHQHKNTKENENHFMALNANIEIDLVAKYFQATQYYIDFFFDWKFHNRYVLYLYHINLLDRKTIMIMKQPYSKQIFQPKNHITFFGNYCKWIYQFYFHNQTK